MESNSFLSAEEEKPLTTCKECQTQECIKTGKVCNKVEALLPKPRSGGHRKEFSTDNIEGVYNYMREKETGMRKRPVHWQDEV